MLDGKIQKKYGIPFSLFKPLYIAINKQILNISKNKFMKRQYVILNEKLSADDQGTRLSSARLAADLSRAL